LLRHLQSRHLAGRERRSRSGEARGRDRKVRCHTFKQFQLPNLLFSYPNSRCPSDKGNRAKGKEGGARRLKFKIPQYCDRRPQQRRVRDNRSNAKVKGFRINSLASGHAGTILASRYIMGRAIIGPVPDLHQSRNANTAIGTSTNTAANTEPNAGSMFAHICSHEVGIAMTGRWVTSCPSYSGIRVIG
jgi:hypothetical protein